MITIARKSTIDSKTLDKLESKRNEVDKISFLAEKDDHSFCLIGCSPVCKKNKRFRHNKNYYATTKTEMFKDGTVPICKDCIKMYVYDTDGNINMANFKSVLKLMDLPYIQTEFEKAIKTNKDVFGIYKANVKYNPNFTYDNSSHLATSATFIDDGQPIDIDIEVLRFDWGDHFEDSSLYWLEQRFKNWKIKVKFDNDDFSSENMVRMICLKELDIRNMRSQGLPVNKEEETLLKMLDGAKLTVKSNSDKKEEKISPLGVRIADIELKTPAEVFEDRKLFEDVDGVFDYFKRFILRPLINYVSGSRDMDKEFNVEEAEKYVNGED